MIVSLSRLHPLRTGETETRLDLFPQDLRITEVIFVILVFIGRQVLYLLGIANQFQSGQSNGIDGKWYELPELRLSMPFRVTRVDLKQYADAVDIADPQDVLSSKAQICLFLSALSEPATLLLIGHHQSPIRPLGSVNVRNRFEILRPELCTEETLLGMKESEIRASLVQQTRRVKRGLEIDVVVEVVNLMEDAVVFRQVFTMLQFMKFRTKLDVPPKQARNESTWEYAKSVPFRMTIEKPMAWARICKDYNPIHTSTVAAKLFGFASTIAHGNHALAIAVAALESEGQSIRCNTGTLEVEFRRPIALPASLEVQTPNSVTNVVSLIRINNGGKVCVAASTEGI